MQSMIVTVRDHSDRFQYDIEVPADIAAGKLTEDVLEALNGIRPELHYSTATQRIYLNRLGKFLERNETMSEAGVRNGDYVTIEDLG